MMEIKKNTKKACSFTFKYEISTEEVPVTDG